MSLLAAILPARFLQASRDEPQQLDADRCREQAEALLEQGRLFRLAGHLQAAEQRVDEANALLEELAAT